MKGSKTMNDAIEACELGDGDSFTVEVSDAALEAAACVGVLQAKAFTVSLCTVLADCSS
jgi:hypothetical protein